MPKKQYRKRTLLKPMYSVSWFTTDEPIDDEYFGSFKAARKAAADGYHCNDDCYGYSIHRFQLWDRPKRELALKCLNQVGFAVNRALVHEIDYANKRRANLR